MNLQNSQFLSAIQVQERLLNPTKKPVPIPAGAGTSFQEILEQKTQQGEAVRFSKHAALRLSDRGIDLSDTQMERLNAAAAKAGQKGIRESLVIVDEMAFILNIPSKTVITAMSGPETNDNVFTNIDGAVII